MTDWPVFLRELRAEEDRWRNRKPVADDLVGWMPFDIARFVMFLTDAVAVAAGRMFLDVGCGPGTKILLAEELFGLHGRGIEIDGALVARALDMGLSADAADARTWDGYGKFDIVYLNRPVGGIGQFEMEHTVMRGMKPGAVLINVNAMVNPMFEGWEIVAEEWDARDGVWRKP